MSRAFLSLLLMIVLVPIRGRAADAPGCGEVRLDSPGGSMNHIPVVDQGDFGDCEAVVSAEMVDAKRFSTPSSLPLSSAFFTSAIEAAIGTALSKNDTVQNVLDEDGNGDYDICKGGFVSYLAKNGSCDARITDGNGDIGTLLTFLDGCYAIDDEIQDKPKNQVYETKELQKMQKLLAGCFQPQAGFDDLERLLQSSADEAGKKLAGEVETSCRLEGRQPVPNFSCKETSDLSPRDAPSMEKFILSHFTAPTAQPLSIGWCSEVLSAGRSYVGLTDDSDQKDDCGGHQSLLIGKRTDPKTGRCQVLIQNSWGTDCSDTSSDWDCDPTTGKTWVDLDAMANNIDDYEYLK